MKDTIPGVLYGRYSPGSKQRERDVSIEQQFKECREYCKRLGIRIVGEYADRALTGTNDKRPQFQKMVNDSARGKFQVVVCWRVDRFARSREDSAIYKGRLRRNGVRVMYAKEDIPEGPEGILLEGNLETYAEFFSKKLSQDIRRGLKDNAENCKVNGVVPLGYRRSATGYYEIEPKGAEIVRKVFQAYAAGVPLKSVADDLNAQGYRSSKGARFNKGSFWGMLKNERYVGTYIYGDVRVEGGIPSIIDRQLFEKVQGLIVKHKKSPAAKWKDYILTGKLYCGLCGSPMVGDGGTSRSGKVYYYYTCLEKKSKA
jgi:DNA invertase Pin-like site-specific DNA recombinase